jgi:hypothetical protein
MLVMGGVPDRPYPVVAAVAWSGHLTANRSLQLAHRASPTGSAPLLSALPLLDCRGRGRTLRGSPFATT